MGGLLVYLFVVGEEFFGFVRSGDFVADCEYALFKDGVDGEKCLGSGDTVCGVGILLGD